MNASLERKPVGSEQSDWSGPSRALRVEYPPCFICGNKNLCSHRELELARWYYAQAVLIHRGAA